MSLFSIDSGLLERLEEALGMRLGTPSARTPQTREETMNEASRAQGWAICGGAGFGAFMFIVGIMNGSYWALAIPVAILTLFALGLIAWVGYTIATIQVETDAGPEILSTDRTPSAPSTSSDKSTSAEDAA